jgi:hypothetical protein
VIKACDNFKQLQKLCPSLNHPSNNLIAKLTNSGQYKQVMPILPTKKVCIKKKN